VCLDVNQGGKLLTYDHRVCAVASVDASDMCVPTAWFTSTYFDLLEHFSVVSLATFLYDLVFDDIIEPARKSLGSRRSPVYSGIW